MSLVKLDDILFYSSLIGCMALGRIYKKIEDPETKKGFGTGVGILITCLICGNQVIHSFLMVWFNVIIIRCCDKKYVHQISLGYTWLHLIYIHLRSGTSMYALWIQQILALRLVGLAFEIYRWENSSKPAANLNLGDEWKNGPRDKETVKTVTNNTDPSYLTEKNSFFLMLTPMEIISYAFFFIGIHKGPYYRWKIFYDHFNAPFGVLGDCRVITEKKLKKALLCLIGMAVLRVKYPGDVYYKEEFYRNYGTDYRFLYNMSQLMIYCLHYQFVTILCTAVCSETGFGVYPARCMALPGFGPSTNFELLKTASTKPEVAIELEYNFSMLKCFLYEKLLIGPKMRDTMRSWDMPTRYWFWANVYKSCVKSTQEVRSALAYIAWMIWVGPSIQQIIISSTLWLYVQLEKEYSELYNTDEESIKVPWDIGFSIMRIFCLIYLTPCLTMKDAWAVIRYYNSIYWMYHFVLSAFLISVVVVYCNRKGRNRTII